MDTPTGLTATIQIGNSDDGLSQAEWHSFVVDTGTEIEALTHAVHFQGYSQPAAPWQNACWVVEIADEQMLRLLRSALERLAHDYRQDSIALTVGQTAFVSPPKRYGPETPQQAMLRSTMQAAYGPIVDRQLQADIARFSGKAL